MVRAVLFLDERVSSRQPFFGPSTIFFSGFEQDVLVFEASLYIHEKRIKSHIRDHGDVRSGRFFLDMQYSEFFSMVRLFIFFGWMIERCKSEFCASRWNFGVKRRAL